MSCNRERNKKQANSILNNQHIIEIPQFGIKAPKDSGNFQQDYQQQPIITITLDKDFFTHQGINVTPSNELSTITGIGDSMEGNFNSDDPVVVNHEVQSLIKDGIYVFTLGHRLYLKRLKILSNCVHMI